MSKNWNQLLNEHYKAGETAPETKAFSLDMLLESVREVMAEVKISPSYSMAEAADTAEAAPKTDEIVSIRRPTIKITELWGQTENGDRDLMESLMNNIKGGTVKEKIASVNSFMEQQAPEPGQGDISEIMSYLIFLDTFASIISDYGAPVAGFLFEAFLAALMGGTSVQIDDPAQVGATPGSLPIEDVQLAVQRGEDPEPEIIPYSLKVLTKNGQVKGSYKNIIDYFLDPAEARKTDSIVYLIVIKDVDKGSKGWNGILKFYEFTINRDNFLELIGAPTQVDVWDYQAATYGSDKRQVLLKSPAQVKGMPRYKMADGSDIEVGSVIPKGTKVLRLNRTGDKTSVIKGAAKKLYADPEKYKDIAGKFGSPGEVDRATFELLKGTQGYQKEKQWVITKGVYERNHLGDIVLNPNILKAKAEEYTQSLNASIINIFNALGDLSDNINKYFIGAGEGSNRKMIGQEAKQNAEQLKNEVNVVIKA
jgi:hypothetical protein